MAEQPLCASLWVQDKWHRGSASEEAPSPPLEVNSARQTPLQRSHQSGHGGEKKSVRRETQHTHTHSLARTPGTSIHVHTHVRGRRGTEEAMYSAAQRGPWLVQSQRKGWAGNTTSPWRAGPSQPQGPGTQHRGVQRPQSPQESESGPRHLGILAHTPHTHTHKCMPPCALGAQMPYLVDRSPW